MTRKILLMCGVLSSLLYLAMNVFVAMQWDGYSSASQTISELSAIGAPTRPLWVPLGIVYALLLTAFGWGVWGSARASRPLRVVGGVLIANGLFSLGWPPMHQRAVLAAGGGTLTDTMHIVWSMVTVLLMMLAIGFGAAAFGKRFRFYSIATMVIMVAFGVLTGMDAPRVQANLPTPWLGIWERISVAAGMLWVAALAVTLLRVQDAAAVDSNVPRVPIPASLEFDRFARGAQFRDRIAVVVRASPDVIFRALREVALRDIKLAWALGEIRYLPSRLGGHMPAVDARRSFLSLVIEGGTLVLRDDSPHELITGSAAQLHRVNQAPRRFTCREAFDAFYDGDYEKLFMSIRVAPTGRPHEQWLVLEHATRALSPVAAHRFSYYWRLIKPLGAFVSWQLLRAIRRKAQRAVTRHHSRPIDGAAA